MVQNARYMALKNRTRQAEGAADQLQIIISTKNNRLQNLENDDLLESKTYCYSRNNVKKVTGRKKINSPSKKRQPEIPPQPGEKGNKDFMEISDDVSLKKRKKRLVNFTFEGDSKAAELEFERLSKLKTKVDSMKQKLTAIQN